MAGPSSSSSAGSRRTPTSRSSGRRSWGRRAPRSSWGRPPTRSGPRSGPRGGGPGRRAPRWCARRTCGTRCCALTSSRARATSSCCRPRARPRARRDGRRARMRRPHLPRTTTYDLPLVAVVLALVAIGLAMVYSASGIRALDTLDDPSYFLVQQSAWAAIGIAGMLVAARIDHRRLRGAALPLVAVSLVLLVVVLVPGVGTCAAGACRWLRLSSFAGVQPAEVAKLAL